MGQVNSTKNSAGGDLASIKISPEIVALQSAFKVYKKDGEKCIDQPKISSEVFLSSLTQESIIDYVEPQANVPRAPGAETSKLENSMNNLIRDSDIISKIYEHVKSKMRASPIEFDNFLEESNFQKNSENLQGSSIDALMIKKAMQEVTEDLQLGMKTPESHLEMLKTCTASSQSAAGASESVRGVSSSYDKFFLVSEKAQIESQSYHKHVICKQIYILYSIYLQRQKLNDEDKKDFFDYVTKFLNIPSENEKEKEQPSGPPCDTLPRISIADTRSQLSLDTGLKFSMNILRELGKVNRELMTSSLQCLLDTFKQYRPGSLYSTQDRMAYQIDQNLNEARDFLVEEIDQILNKQNPVSNKEFLQVAVKIILMLGITRSNIEDYLIVLKLLDYQKNGSLSFLDLSEELTIISSYYGYGGKSSGHACALDETQEADLAPKNYKVGQLNLLTSIPIQMLMSSGHLLELRNSEGDRMVADDDYFYIYKKSGAKGFNPGIYKLNAAFKMQSHQGAAFRMAGKIMHQNTSEPFVERHSQVLDSFMVLIDGNIYMKYEESPEAANAAPEGGQQPNESKPESSRLMMIDTQTLEPLRTYSDQKSLKTVALEHIPTWKSQFKEYRNQQINFDGMPMITEGDNLYVFGRQKKKINDSTEQMLIIINIYQIERGDHLPEFKYLRQVTLFKNGFEPFIKDKNSEEFVGQKAQWATNGQVLICFGKKNKLHWFDLSTGRKISKTNRYWTSSDPVDDLMIYFNYQTNQFTRMLTFDHSIDVNKFWIFTYSNFKVRNQQATPKYQVAKMRSLLAADAHVPSNENLNVIRSLMKKPKKIDKKVQKGATLDLSIQKFLLLDIINHFCQENFAVEFEEIQNKSAQSKKPADILKLFKYKNCTYLTESAFIHLADNLMTARQVLSEPLTSSQQSISQQYSLLFLLNLVSANFKALNHCQIKLSFLLDDELAGLTEEKKRAAQISINQQFDQFWRDNQHIQKGYQYFMTAFESTIVAIVEKAQHKQSLPKIQDQATRDELTQLWSQIEEVCRQIIDGSVSLLHQDPASMIQILLDGLNKPEISLQNICVQISYLNLKDNLKKVVDHPRIQELTLKISELFSGYLVYKDYSRHPSNQEYAVELTTRSYLLNYTQLVLQKYCEEQEHMVAKCKKLQSRQNQHIVEESPEQKQENEDTSLSNKYEQLLVEVTMLTYSYLQKHLQAMLDHVNTEFKSEQQQIKQIEMLNGMGSILSNRDVFYETAFVLNQTFALLKLDSFQANMVGFLQNMMSVLEQCSKFQEIKLADNKEIRYVVPEFMVIIDKLQRQITWLMAQTAYRMIQVKKVDDEPEKQEAKEKMSDQQKKNLLNIQESNLLAGGIETRHLASVLSQERQQLLKTYLLIIDDKFLSQNIDPGNSTSPDDFEDDRILNAIIHSGKDESTDCLIKCLQKAFESKLPMVGHSRVAGANGLRMTRSAFSLLIKFSDMLEDFVSVVDQVQFFNEIESKQQDINHVIEFLKELPQFPLILEKWEQASRMRKWIQDFKNQMSINYESEVTAEVIQKKKAEQKDKEAEANKAAEQISSSEAESNAAGQKSKDTNLTEEDKTYISDEAFNRVEKELESIFSKIEEKAQFLIKLQIPLQFLNKKISVLESTEIPKKAAEESKQTKAGKKAAGTNPPAGVQSCVQCVLSLLQAPVEYAQIQEQVELIYQNACKRVTGLKMIANLVQLNAPQYIQEDTLNWFCAALRGNKNKIAHYMDDIKGEGTYLENKTRMYFFQILAQIVKRLKESKCTATIKYLLKNALEWKFMGRDHQNLLELGIFQVLHRGDGSRDNLLRRSWGKNLHLGTKQYLDEQSASKDVIEYFENLFISIIARIVDPSSLEVEPQSKKKKNQLSLQKAKSVIDEDVSETLLVQGFDIIFKELNRYVKIMNNLFRGIDWSTYVKSRTSEDAKKTLSCEIVYDRLLDDEIELEPGKKTENASSQQKQPDKNADEEPKQEGNSEEILKQNAEARQKLKIKKQLSQIDKIYHESFLKRLLRLVEIFTCVQSSKALQNQVIEKSKGNSSSDGLGQYHINLLAKLSTSGYLATLLNLLVLASPQVKAIILKIIQHLVRVHQISHKVFDQAVWQIVSAPTNASDSGASEKVQNQTEASIIYNTIKTSIAKFDESPFLKFLFHYLYSIRQKMWSKSHLESEGAYAISAELIRTLRFIYEENNEPAKSQNYVWRQEIDKVFAELFKNFGKYKKQCPIEIDIIMSLIRGCEYQGMIPYASAIVTEPQAGSDNHSSRDSNAETKSSENLALSKKYVHIVGFVHKKWLQRGLDWSEDEKRVYEIMKDANQKVLCMQYDPRNAQDAQHRIYEPQNLSLISDLRMIGLQDSAQKRGKKVFKQNISTGVLSETTEAQSEQPAAVAKEAPKQFQITSEFLNTILRESNILSNGSKDQDKTPQNIHDLSQKAMVMKLIHFQLEHNTESFLKNLKSSQFYQEFLRYVCQESSSQDIDESNQITLIDWLEQRCAAIRLHACENQSCLMKQQEVKVQMVKDHLYVQRQVKNESLMTAIQLISAINYQSFEEKKEFKLVNEIDVAVSQNDSEKKNLDMDDEVTETSDIVLVTPESLKNASSKGFDILNESKAIITTQVDLNDLVRIIIEKQRLNQEKYATLALKTIFLVDKAEFETIIDIMNDKGQQENQNQEDEEKLVQGATKFEENLIQDLIKYGGFQRVVAEKIIAKEGSLEDKTLYFSQIVKQIKDGVIDIKELEEQHELQKQEKSQVTKKKKRRTKAQQIPQRAFARPEEKCEVLNFLKRNFHNYINRDDRDMSIEEFNDRHAYFNKVNCFGENEQLPSEYEMILKRLFSMYCRQIFWSLIQNDDIESIFEQIWETEGSKTQDDMVGSLRSFCNFIKVIGNECFITNNQKYIASFRKFLRKVVQTCCNKESKFKTLITILIKEAFIESYHEHFGELTGESNEFNKHIFEYFQSESKAEQLLNPIVLHEILSLIFEYDVSIIMDNLVDIISLYSAVTMYFEGNYDLKSKVFEQLIRILELVRKTYSSNQIKQINEIINLKIFQSFLVEFLSYNSYSMEEAQYAKRILKDDSSKELNGFSRKLYERQVYLYRDQVHQKYIEYDQSRRDSIRLIVELAFKLRQLSEIKEVDVYYHFQNNLMSYVDLYQRSLAQQKEDGEHQSLNKYLTFYNSLEAQKKIFSQDFHIKNPDEGCDIQTVEVDYGDIEKILVRLDSESQFSSQGAAVVISQDKDCKHIIGIYQKTLFQKDQTLMNVYSKGKSFYIHYPVYPNYNYMVSLTSNEPKFDLMGNQQFEQFDNFTHMDRFGTLYLGGNHQNLHHLQSGDVLKPYRNHLDIKRANFGKNLMILLLQTGQVYALGINKFKHFSDHEQSKEFLTEQQIPFHDTKDKIETIETYKRCTVAVTLKGKVYAVGDKLKKMLKIKNDRFGFYPLPLEDPVEEEDKDNDATKDTQQAKTDDNLIAQNVWISKCKAQNNYVIYCLFKNKQNDELELYSIGRNQGCGLLGLGENVQEALSFKKISFETKITSVEGVDIRCGLSHTIIGLNNYEQIYVLGCYDKSSQTHEEINFKPKPLKLCEQFKILKFDTEKQKSVIVVQKKDSEKVQVLIGQFAPISKEDDFKTAQFDLDLSGRGPNRVTQLYVRNESVYVSTSGTFNLDPYDTAGPDFKRGFEAQHLKQSISKISKPSAGGSKSGIILKLTPDYGFFENADFIKHQQADWDRFEKALVEYKEVLKDEPEAILEFEKMVKEEFTRWLKDDSFLEINTFWKNIKEKGDIDQKGFKSKNHEKINELVSVECKKYNLGLYATYCSHIWGSLSNINKSVESQTIPDLSLLSTFMQNKANVPWCVLNKHIKLHLNNLQTDSDNISIHVNRKKALDFAQSDQVDSKGEHTIFSQVKKKLESSKHRGMHINSADKKAWFVKFIGEYALDEGGLFRESLSEICTELKSHVLPLLLQSKNQQNGTGIDQDMYVLNPGATSEVQLKMIDFLGALFGMSIRSGILLDLNISRFVWKQIAGDEVTKEDLRFIDDLYVKDLDNVLAKSQELTDEQFNLEFGETHTMSTMLSDNRVVDLIENGRNVPLKRSNAQLFYDRALQARLNECKPQVQALVAGIDKTFDRKILRLINWKYLEYKVVGMNEVSVDRLKQITAYRNCSDTHEVIKRFWTVLEGFTNEEKISYLRFVWGRTRLPLKEEEGVENHTIQLDENADSKRLPIGRTCFFRLELPPYESIQIMKSKLLYSIIHCRAIDADFDRAGAPNEEENAEEVPAEAAAQSEDSDNERQRRRAGLFGDEENSYGGSDQSGVEEEE